MTEKENFWKEEVELVRLSNKKYRFAVEGLRSWQVSSVEMSKEGGSRKLEITGVRTKDKEWSFLKQFKSLPCLDNTLCREIKVSFYEDIDGAIKKNHEDVFRVYLGYHLPFLKLDYNCSVQGTEHLVYQKLILYIAD